MDQQEYIPENTAEKTLSSPVSVGHQDNLSQCTKRYEWRNCPKFYRLTRNPGGIVRIARISSIYTHMRIHVNAKRFVDMLDKISMSFELWAGEEPLQPRQVRRSHFLHSRRLQTTQLYSLSTVNMFCVATGTFRTAVGDQTRTFSRRSF